MTQEHETYTMEPQPARGTSDALLGFLKSVEGKPVQIDASDVSLLVARQLQVLMSAKRQWDADGLAFEVASASDAFRSGLAGFGLPENYFENEVNT